MRINDSKRAEVHTYFNTAESKPARQVRACDRRVGKAWGLLGPAPSDVTRRGHGTLELGQLPYSTYSTLVWQHCSGLYTNHLYISAVSLRETHRWDSYAVHNVEVRNLHI